ncbi:MAG TPA: hypothetical protein VLC09_17060 [Polyangiaceae bacterium]|nr:hypothetical protein [Polyangiaceae bacterium]
MLPPSSSSLFRAFSWSALLGLAGVACSSSPPPSSPPTEQSGALRDTYAGKNACNPDDHDRPFIIEWDATDMSSFEQYAAGDLVVVKYEGCHLKVMDECRDDNVRGSQGAYKPPEWTTGQLESIDIQNQGDLVAKLPLGEATLGGRVSAGEKFHMEYYVAGTRQATRPALYREELAKEGCEGATHFVYAYNLGAFALGSARELNASAEVSAFGFGTSGSQVNKSKIDKKGGDLSVCKADSAREIEGCKAPIRLSLRKIREGENPNKEAQQGALTDPALNAVGAVNMKVEMSEDARARLDAAIAKIAAGDGRACLIDLDAHDGLDPTHKSSDPKSGFGLMRAQCLMLGGQCDAGKQLGRKALENMPSQMAPEQIDAAVEAYAMQWCRGKMSDRDALLQALLNLRTGAYQAKKDAAFCQSNFDTAKKLKSKVKPKDDDDRQIIDIDISLYSTAPLCLQRAGDCALARKAFDESIPKSFTAHTEDPKEKAALVQKYFESSVPKCVQK